MSGNSRRVESIQTRPHPRLREIVLRHLSEPYRRVPSARGRAAFESIADRLSSKPFVLDAGCGTGESTIRLAAQFADRFVLGVDKSEARLAIGRRALQPDETPRNIALLQCELVDFWQLASQAGLRCERQFVLYPNPWPKPAQVKRRWQAHPILPAIMALGGILQLRTNWKVYAEEFAGAMRIAGIDADVTAIEKADDLTPFERKYRASGHALWRCSTQLPETVTKPR
jgi:tRNA (guanine-N7-)-methyltransferase